MSGEPLEAASGDTPRRLAVATGVLFLITHVTSVPAGLMVAPLLEGSGSMLGAVTDASLLMVALLEVVCALAVVGTSVALFPVVRRRSEAGALGYVGLRTLEAGVIAVGVVPLLALTVSRPSLTGADGAALGATLVELHAWARLVGPGLICGANTTVMAYLLYTSRLVPRFIPTLGLAGGPLVFAHSAAEMLGASQQVLAWTTIAVVPIFAWELSLAIWLIAMGFRIAAGAAGTASPSKAYPMTSSG